MNDLYGKESMFGWSPPLDNEYVGSTGIILFKRHNIPIWDFPHVMKIDPDTGHEVIDRIASHSVADIIQDNPYPDYIVSICKLNTVVKLDNYDFDWIVKDLKRYFDLITYG